MKKQFTKVIAAAMLALLVVTTLAACNSASSKQVPVYQGMTISNAPELFAYSDNRAGIKQLRHGENNENAGLIEGDYDGRNDNFNPDRPFDPDVPTIEEKAASTLDIIGASEDIYYADAGQDVYITVRLSNPDSYEILSFTLNGKKYSSYMFEEGSDMENLVLKVDKNSLGGGINEYTIDTIKYVDGTDIKDVLMYGDRTVKIGVRVGDEMTRAVIANEQIGLTSVQFDVTIEDNYNLIARNNGYVEAVLYDGLKMIYKDIALDGTTTHVEFDNLLPNTLYQYAIVAPYDDLSGNGVQLNTLYKHAFDTDTIVLFADVELTQTGASWSYTWHDSIQNKQITSLQLTKDGSKVRDLPADATSADDLLSDNEYTLTATYKNIYGTNENISIVFTTLAKTAPMVEINNAVSTQTEIAFEISIIDAENVGQIKSIELLHDANQPIIASDINDRHFTNLLSNNDYTIQVTYEYDLNDGKDKQYIVKTYGITTKAKTTPSVIIDHTNSTKNTIEADLSYTDPNNVGTITEIALYNGDDKITTTDWRDHVIFSELNDDTDYTIKVTLVYDLNDGKGQQTLTSECTVHTLPTFRYVVNDTSVEIIGVVYNDGDSIVFPDYIKGLPVKKIGSVFNNARLRRVVLPDTLEELGTQAFYNTNVDEEIVIPRNVQTIGEDAFCNFYGKVTFDENCSIKVIGKRAFYCAKIDNVLILPSTVTRIDNEAFYWTSLHGLVLNEGLVYIGNDGLDILGGMYVYLPSTVKTCNNPGTTVFVSSENKNGIKGSKASRHTVRLHTGETTTTLTGEYFILPDQTQPGKRFLGWKDANGDFVQKVYCPTANVDLYAEFVDNTESDGITQATPLRIQDGESVKVRLFGLDKLYFIIDTSVESDYVVSMKVSYLINHDGTSVDNMPIYSTHNGSLVTVTETDKAFRYTPQTVLSMCPFTSGHATMRYPFEVELTVTAV